LGKEDFENILGNYRIGEYKSHRHLEWALANTVYELKTTKGKFLLKIFEKSDPGFINYQIKVIDCLTKYKVPVAGILKANDKKELMIYNKKRMLVQEFVEGKTQEKYNGRLLKDIARNFGLMSKALLNLKIQDKSKWKKDYQFKPYGKIKIKDFTFSMHASKLSGRLRSLNRSKLKRSITHGDFHGANLVVRDNKLKAIIDFDDSHEDYVSYEIAVFMIDPFIAEKSFDKNLAKIFFKEYQSHVKLNEEEKRAIYYFVKHRLLGIMAWIDQKKKTHQDHKEKLGKTMNKMISKFNSFDKTRLEEFIEL
jgi:Ser/Thr protein kinase RdoA (MazF antagonist)